MIAQVNMRNVFMVAQILNSLRILFNASYKGILLIGRGM